jgi:hypothetical protein
MADQKISGLTADTSPTSDDLIVTVNAPAGTPANRKVTLTNAITKAHGLGDGIIKVATGVMAVAAAGTDYYNPAGTDVALADGGTGASLSDPGSDKIMVWDDSASATAYCGAGTGLSIDATPDLNVTTATTSAAGISELAIASEVTTGTDATRAVTPDALAGSTIFGAKAIEIVAVDYTTDVTVADGHGYVVIPQSLNGMNLIRANAVVITAGTTNATTVAVYNVTDGAEMLSGDISIASGATVGTAGSIDTDHDDVVTNDVLSIDVDAASDTPPKGLIVILEFMLP